MEGCAGWLWGKLWQLHPWIPLRTVPNAGSIQKSHQKMMLWTRKTCKEAAGAQGLFWGPHQEGRQRQPPV